MLIRLLKSALSLCSGTPDRHDLSRPDWNTECCTHGTLQEACHRESSACVFLSTHSLAMDRNAQVSPAHQLVAVARSDQKVETETL